MWRNAVVTGIGIVNPLGVGRDQFWSALSSGRSAIGKISRFPTAGFPVRVAAEIRDFDPATYVPKRLLLKTDRFIHYALAAADLALGDARLALEEEDRSRIGVWFGNNSGGWDICERGFKELYGDGAALVNPWQATAWFPTAAQGYVTIRYGLRGFSKSFVCDRASGASAIHYGARAVNLGHADVVLIGGTEAPLTPFGAACYFDSGELSASDDAAYRPFDVRRSGVVLGEGSTVLVVEEERRARARGAHIYGVLRGSAMTTDSEPGRGEALVRAMNLAVDRGGMARTDVDVLFAEGCGTATCDRVEARAIRETFGTGTDDLLVTAPKGAYGHLFGASAATELACGLLSMETGHVPPTPHSDEVDRDCPIRLATSREARVVDGFLVNARSREGVNVSVAVGRA